MLPGWDGVIYPINDHSVQAYSKLSAMEDLLITRTRSLRPGKVHQTRKTNNRQQDDMSYDHLIRTIVGQSFGIVSTKKAMSRAEVRCQRKQGNNSLAWGHNPGLGLRSDNCPQMESGSRAGKLEQERASRTNVKPEVGGVGERQCKDVINEKEPD